MKNALTATTIFSLALSACEPTQRPAIEAVPELQAIALYRQHCALCHGEAGDGYGLRRGSLHRKPADFADPVWREGRSAEQVAAAIRDGIPGSDMPAWRRLSEPEIAGLAEYVLGIGLARASR